MDARLAPEIAARVPCRPNRYKRLRMLQMHEGLLISSAGYYNPSNQTYANGVMASYVLPLALGAVPTSEIKAVSDGLLRCLVPSRYFF